MRWASCNSSESLRGHKGRSGIVNSFCVWAGACSRHRKASFGSEPLVLAGSAADSFCE
jgi:hypothetical protein